MNKGKPESVVLSMTLQILRRHKVFCWRQNTGAFKTVNGGYFRSSMAGVSDILGLMPDGRFIAVECKREKGGRISEAQEKFLENIKKNNGLAFVVSDPTTFEKLLNAELSRGENANS